MIPLLDIVGRTSFIGLVGLLSSRLLRNRSAALRHVTLAMSLVAAVTVVPLTIILPRWNPLPLQVEGPRGPDSSRLTSPERSAPMTPASPFETSRSVRGVSGAVIVGVVWTSGVAVFGLMLLVGIRRLLRIDAAAECVRSADWRLLVDAISAE